MVDDFDAALADLEQQQAMVEQQRAVLLPRLAVELAEAGAAWNQARGTRRSLQRIGGQPHPTMTHLQQKIRDATAAGMGQREIARLARVTRWTVRDALAD